MRITAVARKNGHTHNSKQNHRCKACGRHQQRISRLVRSTLAFSKKADNHVGAIRSFICRYNLTRTTFLV